MPMNARTNWIYPAGYVCLWAATTWWLSTHTTFGAEEALAGFVILGVIFPALTLLLTRGSLPLEVRVNQPRRESLLLLAYLVLLAIVLVYGFEWVNRITTEP